MAHAQTAEIAEIWHAEITEIEIRYAEIWHAGIEGGWVCAIVEVGDMEIGHAEIESPM